MLAVIDYHLKKKKKEKRVRRWISFMNFILHLFEHGVVTCVLIELSFHIWFCFFLHKHGYMLYLIMFFFKPV